MNTPEGKHDNQKEADPEGQRTSEKEIEKPGFVDRMIERFEQKLDREEIKLTIAEYIRLVQLREDLGPERPEEIKVTWVGPSEEESVTRK